MPKWIRRRAHERETERGTGREEKEGHGHGEEVEGTKGLSAPCLPGINHVSVMLNRWPPARDGIDRIAIPVATTTDSRRHPPLFRTFAGRDSALDRVYHHQFRGGRDVVFFRPCDVRDRTRSDSSIQV